MTVNKNKFKLGLFTFFFLFTIPNLYKVPERPQSNSSCERKVRRLFLSI